MSLGWCVLVVMQRFEGNQSNRQRNESVRHQQGTDTASRRQVQRTAGKTPSDRLREKHPQVVCFHFPSTFLTHRYVLDMVRQQLKDVVEARVVTIQFIDRNTIHGTQVRDVTRVSQRCHAVTIVVDRWCLAVCLSVCHSVSRITHERVYGCRPNIADIDTVWPSRSD